MQTGRNASSASPQTTRCGIRTAIASSGSESTKESPAGSPGNGTAIGDARYQSTGWGSYVGNDGQPGDATLGVDQYYARNYDPSVGSWLEPDDWRGLLTQPQTLNRHAYVTNNPATYSDLLGYLQMRFDGGRAGKFIPMSVSVALDKRDRTRIKNYVNSNRNAVGKPPIETLGTLDGKRGGPSPTTRTT